MKKVIKTIFCVFNLLVVGSVFSQAPLSIQYANGTLPPDSIQLGDSFHFDVKIINDTTSTFQGTPGFYYSINAQNYISSDTNGSGVNSVQQPASILPFDSVKRTISVVVTGPQFIVGPSVVVIWPIVTSGNAAYALDTIRFTLNVTDPLLAKINEVDNKRLKLYVNGNSLRVDKDSEILLRRVRIFDILGEQILNQSNPNDNIPLPYMSTGIYLAEVTYNNNLRRIFRICY